SFFCATDDSSHARTPVPRDNGAPGWLSPRIGAPMTKIVRTVACIDGSQMLYRAEFRFPARIRNRAGHDVIALFVFLALTGKALISSPKRPTHAVVVFDGDAPTHRSTLDLRYRATRQPLLNGSPTNPFRHLPWILRALQAWGMACIEHTTSEADDVI